MRYEVIDDEHLAQRNRQVHEPLQIYGLGALQFGEQADQPEEKKRGGDAEPDPHDDQRRCLGQAEGRAEQGAHEAQPAHHECAQSGEHGDDRAQPAAARPLIAREPPAQPEDGLELAPIHRVTTVRRRPDVFASFAGVVKLWSDGVLGEERFGCKGTPYLERGCSSRSRFKKQVRLP